MGIGQSNKARMGNLAYKFVTEECKLSKGWNAVSMSATEGNNFPTDEQFKNGIETTFIEARDEDSIEFEEDQDHVLSAERDLLINSENLDEFRNNVLMKLNLDSSNGISCYSNLLISSTFGGYRTQKKDEDIAMFRLKYHLVPLINSVIQNELSKESMSLLNISRIAMIPKVKEGTITGHRAIGIGECIYRLVAKWISFKMNDKILDIVQPDQYGIKIKGGPEILKHLFQCFFDENRNENLCALLFDIKNGFGSVFKSTIYDILRRKCPELCNIFLATYKEESKLINWKGDQVGSCKAGTKQGDPLSMIYFCLVMEEATSKIEKRLREMQTDDDFKIIKMMYADDFTLFGNPSFLIENFNIIVEEFAKVGLEVQPSKMKLLLTKNSITPVELEQLKSLAVSKDLVCISKEKVIGSDGIEIENEVKKCIITKEGVIIMGCPVGTDSYILKELDRIRKEFDEECSALENLVCPVDSTYKALHPQVALALLTKCLNTKLIYDLRTIEPRLLESLLIT